MSGSAHKYTASAEAGKELLTGGGEFLPPESLLSDLTEADDTSIGYDLGGDASW